uniref:Uncharacterized protein n=1 Tax=Timema cristinae TaxID=61476 RepID=A0A7R9H622_TIMCR|nr:unnamed protein product [Timema cristinae]
MCENFYPVVARSKWPLLSCCDDSDFCNEGPFSNPRPLSREHSTAGAKVYNTGEVLLRDLLNHTRFSSNNGSTAVNKTYSVNQSVVLSVLFVGLFLLVAILAFGFYVLRKQSTYFKHHMCSILTGEDPSLLVLHSERRNTKLTSKQLQSEKLRCSET